AAAVRGFAEILLVRRGPYAHASENLMVARAPVLLRDTGYPHPRTSAATDGVAHLLSTSAPGMRAVVQVRWQNLPNTWTDDHEISTAGSLSTRVVVTAEVRHGSLPRATSVMYRLSHARPFGLRGE